MKPATLINRCCHALVAGLAATVAAAASAGTGLARIEPGPASTPGEGPVKVFYPTSGPDQPVQRGPFTLALAPDAPPQRGNGALIVVSHGSGSALWPAADLARALVAAAQDRWLAPRFHSDAVLAASLPRCTLLAALPQGGHGALLSPPPTGLSGAAALLLNDPPGFDRAEVAGVNAAIAAFFVRHLVDSKGAQNPPQ